MKILHIIHALQKSAGTSVFCIEICRNLQERGHEILVVCQGEIEYECENIDVRRIDDFDQINFSPDMVHVHGLWDYFMHQSMCWCRQKNLPYVISLHGCLMPRALLRSKWKKKLALTCYLAKDIKKATLIHVTSMIEKEAFDAFNLGVEIEIIPLGCELPVIDESTKRKNTVLFLSRISPEKGLNNLLKAWARLQTQDWELVIAGPDWRGHLAEVKEQAEVLNIQNVRFCGAVYGREKEKLYRSASLFVLPSFNENFSVVIAEALSLSLPVITTKGTPWSELLGSSDCMSCMPLTDNNDEISKNGRCGWWIEIGVEPLAAALGDAIGLSEENRRRMGECGRKLIEQKYSWMAVTERTQSMYLTCLNK